MELAVRRVFVAAWILLGLAGALDHTIAEKVLGTRVDLLLPHLKYGYVMFNVNPRTVYVYRYAGPDGVRHDLADLVPTPAPTYDRARLAVDVAVQPDYLKEVCYRATRSASAPQEYDFFVEEYQVGEGSSTLTRTTTMHCDAHGLVAR